MKAGRGWGLWLRGGVGADAKSARKGSYVTESFNS